MPKRVFSIAGIIAQAQPPSAPASHHQRNRPAGCRRVDGEARRRAADRADDVLPLGADVPDAGAEAQATARWRSGSAARPSPAAAGANSWRTVVEQRVPEDRADRLERVLAPARRTSARRRPSSAAPRHGGVPRSRARGRGGVFPARIMGARGGPCRRELSAGGARGQGRGRRFSGGGIASVRPHGPPPCRGRRPSSGRSRSMSAPPRGAGRSKAGPR